MPYRGGRRPEDKTFSLRIVYQCCLGKGCKPVNQDSHAMATPSDLASTTKGIATALADGISSSDVSRIVSELAVFPATRS